MGTKIQICNASRKQSGDVGRKTGQSAHKAALALDFTCCSEKTPRCQCASDATCVPLLTRMP